MNIVSLENISKNYGFRPLFENVTLGLEDRDKVGIIGANGAGKTTLLRIIAGVEIPDIGRVVRAKGSGLGLFIVRSVARKHGGRAFAESDGTGRGSTFTLLLPKAADA